MHSLSEGRAHSSSRDHVSGNEAYLRSEAQLDTSAGDALEMACHHQAPGPIKNTQARPDRNWESSSGC